MNTQNTLEKNSQAPDLNKAIRKRFTQVIVQTFLHGRDPVHLSRHAELAYGLAADGILCGYAGGQRHFDAAF